jgi:hypothetical protein
VLEIRKLMKTKILTTITSIENINFFLKFSVVVGSSVKYNYFFFIEAAAVILIFSIGHLVKIKRNNE